MSKHRAQLVHMTWGREVRGRMRVQVRGVRMTWGRGVRGRILQRSSKAEESEGGCHGAEESEGGSLSLYEALSY